MYRRIENWMLTLFEYALQYVSQKLVKGEVLTDFLDDHSFRLIEAITVICASIEFVKLKSWTLIFDGSKINEVTSAGVLLIFLNGIHTQFLFLLAFSYSNNQAKYAAQIINLKLLSQLGAITVNVIGNYWVMLK